LLHGTSVFLAYLLPLQQGLNLLVLFDCTILCQQLLQHCVLQLLCCVSLLYSLCSSSVNCVNCPTDAVL
jgi:hypothetical protein